MLGIFLGNVLFPCVLFKNFSNNISNSCTILQWPTTCCIYLHNRKGTAAYSHEPLSPTPTLIVLRGSRFGSGGRLHNRFASARLVSGISIIIYGTRIRTKSPQVLRVTVLIVVDIREAVVLVIQHPGKQHHSQHIYQEEVHIKYECRQQGVPQVNFRVTVADNDLRMIGGELKDNN